jgi:hypothetical protein
MVLLAAVTAAFLFSVVEWAAAFCVGLNRLPLKPIIRSTPFYATKKSSNSGAGFGGGFGASSVKKKTTSRGKGRGDLISALNDDGAKKKESKPSQTFVKSDQEKCKLGSD